MYLLTNKKQKLLRRNHRPCRQSPCCRDARIPSKRLTRCRTPAAVARAEVDLPGPDHRSGTCWRVLLTDELTRSLPPGRVVLQLPQAPVHSDLRSGCFASIATLENTAPWRRGCAHRCGTGHRRAADGWPTTIKRCPRSSPTPGRGALSAPPHACRAVVWGCPSRDCPAHRQRVAFHSPRPGRIGGFGRWLIDQAPYPDPPFPLKRIAGMLIKQPVLAALDLGSTAFGWETGYFVGPAFPAHQLCQTSPAPERQSAAEAVP